jgi:hypothetical protein
MKPKILLCLALVLSGSLFNFANTAWCADESPAIKVMIDIPEICRDGKLAFPRTLGNQNPISACFFVVIENTSSNSIIIPNEDDMNRVLHFEITTDDGKATASYRTPQIHTRYFPHDLRLAPGTVAVCEIYYGHDWETFPFPHDPHHTGQIRKVTLRAVFEQKPFKDTIAPAAWIGKVVSQPCEVLLEDDAL